MLLGSVFLFPEPVPGLLGWAYPEQLGLSSTAYELVLGDSIRPCTNGISLLHRIASVAPKLDAGLMTSLPASDPGSSAVWGSKRINTRLQSCLCLTWSGYPSNDDDELNIEGLTASKMNIRKTVQQLITKTNSIETVLNRMESAKN